NGGSRPGGNHGGLALQQFCDAFSDGILQVLQLNILQGRVVDRFDHLGVRQRSRQGSIRTRRVDKGSYSKFLEVVSFKGYASQHGAGQRTQQRKGDQSLQQVPASRHFLILFIRKRCNLFLQGNRQALPRTLLPLCAPEDFFRSVRGRLRSWPYSRRDRGG